ncbi:MAG TPA: alcohol dehydrogenase catalytic domain-containing protein [Amnibacterium sp.]|jgi:alcohol dehydrogenase|nr:alcohol dehydrogenase catalytic domain-containing protein [Amnibacterium sp.]
MRIMGAVLEEVGRPAPYRRSRPLTVGELDLAEPGPTELRVRVEAAGLCHSDLSVVDGTRPRPVPMLLGHEAAGIVEAAGDAVDDVAVGDRVVLTFLPRCGRCAACATDGRLPCERGSASNAAGELLGGGTRLSRNGRPVAHHLGASAFATHAVVDRRSVVPVGADVPPHVAALLGCAVLTGGGAVRNASGAEPGEPVLVVGLGGVGLAAVLVARALGHPVIGVDALPAKLETARALGASQVATPDALGGLRARVVIEAAGSARALETAFVATAPGGTTVTVGLPSPAARAAIAPLTLTAEARTIVGSYLGSSVPERDVPAYADLWRAGRLPVERLVSAVLPLTELNGALDALASGEALRQLITFDERT